MSYTYISQKLREYDFYLREARIFPVDLPKEQRDAILMIEEGYRRGDINRAKAVVLATFFCYLYGHKYRIISDKHLVIIPKSKVEFMHSFLQYPQLVSIIGNRYAGKTITAWTIAVQTLEKRDRMKMYVYGDVDGMSEQIIKQRPEFEDRIIIKKDPTLPPKDGKEKLILYNELNEHIMGKRAMAAPNLEAALQAFRNRHLNVWVIYNVIRYKSLETELRETADIKLIKWLSPELLESTTKVLPKAYAEILKMSILLSQNENIVFAPVIGKGVKIFVHETNPPAWILKAAKDAKEDTNLMMVKSERERYILQRIGELAQRGLKSSEIQIILQNEGIELSKRSIQMKIKKWRKLVGIEGEKDK